MDGKIIQEVEGIVNGSGFVKMAVVTFPYSSSSTRTLYTDFTPKIVFAWVNESGGFAIKPADSLRSASQVQSSIQDISWYEDSISFTVNSAGVTVAVLG